MNGSRRTYGNRFAFHHHTVRALTAALPSLWRGLTACEAGHQGLSPHKKTQTETGPSASASSGHTLRLHP